MPKKSAKFSRGGRGGRAGNPEDKHYFGHDDRVRRPDGGGSYLGNRPRVSFKTQTRPSRDIPRSLALACLDNDIPMASSSNNNNRQVVMRNKNRGMSRGRNSPLPHRGFRGGHGPPRVHKQQPLVECNLFKITIPHGHKFEKNDILNTLLSYLSPDTFVPIMYKVTEKNAEFYVDNRKSADLLTHCDYKVTMPEGFKLSVRVSRSNFPHCEINEKLKERLKQAMAKRYVQETNALDLSVFHYDPDLVSDYFCALFRPVMLGVVLDIVSEHIPTLEALNLDGNNLQQLGKLNVLSKKFSKLKILYIGDNKIREISQIDVFKGLKLEELRLAGNPVCTKYKLRQSDYISDVRKRFPRLLRLDGVELPRPILFDVVDDGTKIPPPQRMFVANAKVREIALQFLQQYFLIFDSENRQPLLDAYDEHASFSMTATYNNMANKLTDYLPENRNLYRINDSAKRQKLLKQGRLPVVSFISGLPQTSHYLNSFTMDISLVTETMMLITVTGLFKETVTTDNPVRYFNRTFIIVPEGSGYCIRNEQLHINHPTDAQLKHLEKSPSETQMAVAATISQAPATLIAKPVTEEVPENIKQEMTLTLSRQTNMNLEWSSKCLAEVNWNFENALSVFQEFYKRGQVPPEAFNK